MIIAAVTAMTFWPTLRNGFLLLGFDDLLILDASALHRLDWPNLQSMIAGFNDAPYYMPVTMISLALDYRVWGLDPFGYHLTNIALQALAAMFAYGFALPLLGSARRALFAALAFAVHPVQMEAVSLAVQRKTVLAGVFFFLALWLYQRWTRGGGWKAYVACLVAFALAALAKPAVVALPCLLLLYDYTFRSGRPQITDKLPFVAIAAGVSLLAMHAHATLGALQPPHGGTWVSNLLMVSRVMVEYLDALVVPVNLAPLYYYPRAAASSPLNVLALIGLVVLMSAVTWGRRRYPWSFFCLWWIVLALLPESNLVPLAQLRADRYLYFAVLPYTLWLSVGLARLDAFRVGAWPLGSRLVGPAFVGLLAVVCYGSAGIWRDDVSAWSRVVERHPWCGVAYSMLGRAYYEQGDVVHAEEPLQEALRLSTPDPETHLYLARVYAARGQPELAHPQVERFLALVPDAAAGLELRAALTQAGS